MNKYYMELHVHTSEVSVCAVADSNTMIQDYIKAGYSGVVLTNHFNSDSFRNLKDASWSDKIDYFLNGYRKAKKAAGNNLDVLLGMELRFYENSNDYLVYGITEDFLFNNKDFMSLGLTRFAKLAHENGMLIFQAHPFRPGMTISNVNLLDGIEVYNGNIHHNSSNDIALLWANKFNLLKSSGSDYHEKGNPIAGGIMTSARITDNVMLLDALRKGAAVRM